MHQFSKLRLMPSFGAMHSIKPPAEADNLIRNHRVGASGHAKGVRSAEPEDRFPLSRLVLSLRRR